MTDEVDENEGICFKLETLDVIMKRNETGEICGNCEYWESTPDIQINFGLVHTATDVGICNNEIKPKQFKGNDDVESMSFINYSCERWHKIDDDKIINGD